MTEEQHALAAVAGECCLRIAASLHASGEYVHYECVKSCRVRCFHRDCAVPDGFVPSARQEAFWAALDRLEGG